MSEKFIYILDIELNMSSEKIQNRLNICKNLSNLSLQHPLENILNKFIKKLINFKKVWKPLN